MPNSVPHYLRSSGRVAAPFLVTFGAGPVVQRDACVAGLMAKLVVGIMVMVVGKGSDAEGGGDDGRGVGKGRVAVVMVMAFVIDDDGVDSDDDKF